MKSLLLRAGFTMIELLVVIAVIGVLAVAVLSSINPIEQINKGRDTDIGRCCATINAIDRYYAIHEIYPWNDAIQHVAGCGVNQLPPQYFRMEQTVL
jgi:prepilin-type N-terminal cleavage/methylation domain-containing protein